MFTLGKNKSKKPAWREYLEAMLWAVLLALFIRTFLVQSFEIPSGSMIPTLVIGDHLLVNKSSYGVLNPFTDNILIPLGEPKRGHVIVFRFPEDRKNDFIKRIMALPGETVEVRNKTVLINGKPIDDPWGQYTERARINFGPVKVPKDHYFVMGDNRDQSYDSRFWYNGKGGFVPRKDIKGRAIILYWSWNAKKVAVRWNRIGDLLTY